MSYTPMIDRDKDRVIAGLSDRLREQEAEIARLKDALRPFALLCGQWKDPTDVLTFIAAVNRARQVLEV